MRSCSAFRRASSSATRSSASAAFVFCCITELSPIHFLFSFLGCFVACLLAACFFGFLQLVVCFHSLLYPFCAIDTIALPGTVDLVLEAICFFTCILLLCAILWLL